jgi:hypothetical protein
MWALRVTACIFDNVRSTLPRYFKALFMNANRLLPVLLAAMALPACAQDDSGLWAMLAQVEGLSDALPLGQDALAPGAPPGDDLMRSSPDDTRGAAPGAKAVAAGTFGTHAGLGSDAQTLETGKVRLRKAAHAARPG